jgi:hypothetical protein
VTKKIYQSGANEQNRTADLILTKDVLYRLSYIGIAETPKGVKFPLPMNNQSSKTTLAMYSIALESQYFDIIRALQRKILPEKKRQIEYPKPTPFVNCRIQHLSFIFQ